MHEKQEFTGCGCREEFEHDGSCQNALREKKSALCQPCSQGWHHPYPCPEYVPKTPRHLTFQCDRCGWDSAEHAATEEQMQRFLSSKTWEERQALIAKRGLTQAG